MSNNIPRLKVNNTPTILTSPIANYWIALVNPPNNKPAIISCIDYMRVLGLLPTNYAIGRGHRITMWDSLGAGRWNRLL